MCGGTVEDRRQKQRDDSWMNGPNLPHHVKSEGWDYWNQSKLIQTYLSYEPNRTKLLICAHWIPLNKSQPRQNPNQKNWFQTEPLAAWRAHGTSTAVGLKKCMIEWSPQRWQNGFLFGWGCVLLSCDVIPLSCSFSRSVFVKLVAQMRQTRFR